ncbi:MAG TPA: fumarate hydratase [Oscillospiraceae bacterium]|nr:fumarate hydratase [Oscillospiraceae bacterium]
MRELDVAQISSAVAEMIKEANYVLGDDVYQALQQALEHEESPSGRQVLAQLLKNAELAQREQVPLCQDTGFAVVYLSLGQDVHLFGGDVNEAIQEGIRQGSADGYLRTSIVADPLQRVNTNDNTPAVIHLTLVPGEEVKLVVAPKGGGSENVSAVKMLKPAEGTAGVIDFVLETVRQAGSNPCPPVIVGVGIGGTLEKVTELAKRALLRKIGQSHPELFYARLEQELLQRINSLGIGPQGLGGRITALAVHIETYAAHIASLPVAVNINCHAARQLEKTL